MNFFYPDVMLDSAFSLDPDMLCKKGIRCVIFDIDNTLAPYSVKTCSIEAEALLSKLEGAGIHVGFASNNSAERVMLFNTKGRFFVSDAKKPKNTAAKIFCEHFKVTANELAVVGDQIFTDVLLAKNAKAFSILVPPIDRKHEPWYFIFKRPLEKIIIKFYKRKENKNG